MSGYDFGGGGGGSYCNLIKLQINFGFEGEYKDFWFDLVWWLFAWMENFVLRIDFGKQFRWNLECSSSKKFGGN